MAKEPGLGAAGSDLMRFFTRVSVPRIICGLALARKRAKPDAWKLAIQPSMSGIRARPAARAARIRRTGRDSPPRTTRRSISFRRNSSTRDCRECAATAIDARRCRARSAWRRHAGFTRCGPKSAEPACPAMSNAKWREDGTACRRSHHSDRSCRRSPRRRGYGYAVRASAKSSSNSSSIGENVLSGLVESVIGLRLP
jgi:hypothetical protein